MGGRNKAQRATKQDGVSMRDGAEASHQRSEEIDDGKGQETVRGGEKTQRKTGEKLEKTFQGKSRVK